MSIDKAVDSAQLNADLTSVANAIRTKGGTSAQLAFPAGFVQAIGDIPSGGGGYTLTEIAKGAITGAISFDEALTMVQYAFAYNSNLDSVSSHYATALASYAFFNCSNLVAATFSNVSVTAESVFYNCGNLETVDLTINQIKTTFFRNCKKLYTLILRKSDILVSLPNQMAFQESSFYGTGAGSGAGGTIYIPKVLYDHLGDGTSLDYKSATNWSKIDGAGHTTWAQIEGSQYENYYADGTPITT